MAPATLGGRGASGLGRPIAQLLVAAGEQVVDVPAKLAARARLLGTSSARKTDLADACSVATAALHHPRLRPVAPEDQTVIFACSATAATIWSPNGPGS
jgi:hypothetical protein